MRRHVFRLAGCAAMLCFGASTLTAQATLGKAADNHIYAQRLVDELMARHPELIVVGVHVVAPGDTLQTKIATNEDKVGHMDEPDDYMVAQGRKTILAPNLHGLGKYEVLLPLEDASGTVIGALGLVFRYKDGDDVVGLLSQGIAIRDSMKQRIADRAALFAPTSP